MSHETPQTRSEWVAFNLLHALWYYYQGREREARLLMGAAVHWATKPQLVKENGIW